MSETIGWLIERDGKWWGPPCSRYIWLNAIESPDLWTSNASAAVRFARKEDAEHMIAWEGIAGGVKATEHLWVDNVPVNEAMRDASVERFKQRITKMMSEAADRIIEAR